MNDDEFLDGERDGIAGGSENGTQLKRTEVPTHPAYLAPSPGDMRKAYRKALEELHQTRGTTLAEDGYAAKVQEEAFWSFFRALGNASLQIVYDAHPESEYTKNNKRPGGTWQTHVVASAPGSGKSTLAKAFATALTRVNEDRPYPLGCVFLVHHIATAQAFFLELSALVPERVAVFSTQHDAENAQANTYTNKYKVGDLEKYPIVVVTHEFYMGLRGDYARSYTKGDLRFPRAVAFIDERVNEIAVYDLDPLGIEGVLKHVQTDNYAPPDFLDAMLALERFKTDKRYGELAIETPIHDREAWKAAVEAMGYLRTEDAARYARSASLRNSRLDFDAVIGFVNAATEDRAFIARQNKGMNSVNFVGYDRALPQLAGMVLLDATADIDGVTKVCPWRKHAETPPEKYDSLEIIHVPSVAKGNIRRWLGERGNIQAYTDHIRDLIVRNVAQGQKALLVCTKDVVRAENIKSWSEHMEPFLKRTMPAATAVDTEFTEGFAWSLDGRQIVVTWFGGYGIGANVWRDADVVIICDDFYLPQRTIKATLQGLKGHTATEGLLARSGDAWSEELEYLRDGHILRWMKQMALRGKAREMDENGICGPQRLVITGDLIRLLAHRPKVFPGAKIKTEQADRGQLFDRLVAVLLSSELNEVSTKVIEDALDRDWGDISGNLKKHKGYEAVLDAIGWTYHRGQGRTRGCFRRVETNHTETEHVVVDDGATSSQRDL